MTTRVQIINYGPGVVKVSLVGGGLDATVYEVEEVAPHNASQGIKYAYPGQRILVEEK